KEVDKFITPKNKKELQGFLEFMNYFRPYIYNFAKIADPSYKLTSNTAFKWTMQCQETMNKLKEEMKQELYLSFSDPNHLFFMECDASQEAIGAILYQEITKT
ncbi:289_t:CDS:1, partial [Gigaspora rosea]